MRRVLVLAMLLLGVTATTAAAQDERWEVEFFGGAQALSNPTDGATALPPAGDTFTTLNVRTSRRVSSWFFGDGTLLFNQVNAALGRSERIVSLDDALKTSMTKRAAGGGGGVRVRRHLTDRVSAEFSLEFGSSTREITGAAKNAFEATRASFPTAWTGLFATGGGVIFQGSSIASTVEMTSGGQELSTTGAVNYVVARSGRMEVYVTGGAGSIASLGDDLKVTITGNVRTQLFGASPLNERDVVTVELKAPSSTFVVVYGGGVTHNMSSSWGVRADVRVASGKNGAETLVDATPFIETTANGGVLPSNTTPSLQFRNSPIPGAGAGNGQPTFGGPAITDFKTYDGSGMRNSVSMTGGVFFRF